MELVTFAIDLFLHLDKHLAEVVHDYGAWTYGILFAIVFCETSCPEQSAWSHRSRSSQEEYRFPEPSGKGPGLKCVPSSVSRSG